MVRDRLATSNAPQQGLGSSSFGPASAPQYELSRVDVGEHSGMLEDAFYTEISEIQDGIHKLTANVDALSRLHSQQIDAVGLSGSNTSRQLESLTEETRALSFSLKKRIEELKTQPADARTARLRGPQIERMRTNFMDAIQKYQTEEKTYRDRTKDRIARQYMIVNPNASPGEVQAVVQSGQNLQVFSQAMNGTGYVQAQTAYNAVRERHEEIQRIERTLVELAQLFQDMSLLVEQQGDTIDDIEEKAHTAAVDLEKGKEHTGRALISAIGYRKKRWIFLALIVVTIVIIAAVVGCEVSQKC